MTRRAAIALCLALAAAVLAPAAAAKPPASAAAPVSPPAPTPHTAPAPAPAPALPLPAAPPTHRPAPQPLPPPPGAKLVAKRSIAAYEGIAPRAAAVFDVDSGRLLSAIDPERRLPIASLTKMMTALLIAERHSPDERMMISAAATEVPGSRIGVLPRGKLVPLGPVFTGMMLVSGNDAAEALAEHDSGSSREFVLRMNRRARRLGLTCTHFSTPHGLRDEGNFSCARDLAELARTDLQNPWISEIASQRKATYPFPIKGGKLDLANNDYFVQRGLPQIPGAVVTGLKTGYTDPAGRCYVVTARRGGRHLGVVLLHSPDPLHQVPMLLRRGFAAG